MRLAAALVVLLGAVVIDARTETLIADVGGGDKANQAFWQGKCSDVPADATMIKVVMGSAIDYYKPKGVTMCDMLTTYVQAPEYTDHAPWMWSKDGENWKQGLSIGRNDRRDKHLGGSYQGYPGDHAGGGDKRLYTSFWGHGSESGGCCANSHSITNGNGEDASWWGREFKLYAVGGASSCDRTYTTQAGHCGTGPTWNWAGENNLKDGQWRSGTNCKEWCDSSENCEAYTQRDSDGWCGLATGGISLGDGRGGHTCYIADGACPPPICKKCDTPGSGSPCVDKNGWYCHNTAEGSKCKADHICCGDQCDGSLPPWEGPPCGDEYADNHGEKEKCEYSGGNYCKCAGVQNNDAEGDKCNPEVLKDGKEWCYVSWGQCEEFGIVQGTKPADFEGYDADGAPMSVGVAFCEDISCRKCSRPGMDPCSDKAGAYCYRTEDGGDQCPAEKRCCRPGDGCEAPEILPGPEHVGCFGHGSMSNGSGNLGTRKTAVTADKPISDCGAQCEEDQEFFAFLNQVACICATKAEWEAYNTNALTDCENGRGGPFRIDVYSVSGGEADPCPDAVAADDIMSQENKKKCRDAGPCFPSKRLKDDGKVAKIEITRDNKWKCSNLSYLPKSGATDFTDAGCLASVEGCKACFLTAFSSGSYALNALFWNGQSCQAMTSEKPFALTRKVASGSTICKFTPGNQKMKALIACTKVVCSNYTKPLQCTRRSSKEGVSCVWNPNEKICQDSAPGEKCNLKRRACNAHAECKWYTSLKKCLDAVPEEGCSAYKKRIKCNKKSKGKCKWDTEAKPQACVDADTVGTGCDRFNNRRNSCVKRSDDRCEWDYVDKQCKDKGSFTLNCDAFPRKRVCAKRSNHRCAWDDQKKECVLANLAPGCERFDGPNKCTKKSYGRCGWATATGKCVNKDVVNAFNCDSKCCPISFKKLCSANPDCFWNKNLSASLATKDAMRGSRSMGVCSVRPGN